MQKQSDPKFVDNFEQALDQCKLVEVEEHLGMGNSDQATQSAAAATCKQ